MTGFDGTAERLLLHHLSTPCENAEYDGVVIIAGLARIGKSTLAQKVAKTLRMRSMSTDDLQFLYSSLPKNEIHAARQRSLENICRQARGLVLEGMDLVRTPALKGGFRGTDFAFQKEIMRIPNIRIFAVGCCDSSAETWEKVMRTHGGWINSRGEDFLVRFSRRWSDANRSLRDTAVSAGLPYFEIPREDFTKAVERTAAAIIAEVRQGATP